MEADAGERLWLDAAIGFDVDLEAVTHVSKNHLAWGLRSIEGDNIVSQALRGSFVTSAQLPVIHGQETGDGSTEAAERDTVLGELDHQWSNLGGWGEVLWKILVGNRLLETHHEIFSLLPLYGRRCAGGWMAGVWC